jgi:L-amino acid N-acyltransferase YncA
MNIKIRKYNAEDVPSMIRIWNEVVEEGDAFPQEDYLNQETGRTFFNEQTHCAVAEDCESKKIYGLYILHPNNIGRCGHISNASYAVGSKSRGLHIGEKLIQDSLAQAKQYGFAILQFNAVVATNTHARHLYECLGFVLLGTIPGGFHMKDGHYEDICLYYYLL